MAGTRKRAKTIEPEHTLTGTVKSKAFSYYISDHRPRGYSFVDDEAIIDLIVIIDQIEPSNPEHHGTELECSLVCSRRFDRDDPDKTSGTPNLFSMTLRRNQRSMLAYLPADAFWALQTRLEVGSITHLEVSYVKPHRGFGDLTSIYLRGPV
jgi:hypothetical protein